VLFAVGAFLSGRIAHVLLAVDNFLSRIAHVLFAVLSRAFALHNFIVQEIV